MRALFVGLLFVACSPIPLDDDGGGTPSIIANVASTGEVPDPPTRFLRGVVAFAPQAAADYPFAFNDTGIPVSTLPQLPAMTPFLPRPVDEVSMELLSLTPRDDGSSQVETLASTGELEVSGTLEEVILYGSFEEPLGMSLSLDDAPAQPGQLTVRLVHVTPGLQYAGFGPALGAPVVSAFQEETSSWVSLEAGVEHLWYLDVNGDGRGDVPYTGWQLPAEDALGRPQIVDIYVVPSGATLPSPNPPLPVPILVITPLTGPDEAVSAVPALGG